jgi:hypothetical protein
MSTSVNASRANHHGVVAAGKPYVLPAGLAPDLLVVGAHPAVFSRTG